jgi:hypothetical protein
MYICGEVCLQLLDESRQMGLFLLHQGCFLHVQLRHEGRKLLQRVCDQVWSVLRCYLQDVWRVLQEYHWLRQEVRLVLLVMPQEHHQGHLRVSQEDQ